MVGIFTLELSQEMIAGGMNGILPEEQPLNEALCGALNGALRPRVRAGRGCRGSAACLAEQGVGLKEMENVMVLDAGGSADAGHEGRAGTPLSVHAALDGPEDGAFALMRR